MITDGMTLDELLAPGPNLKAMPVWKAIDDGFRGPGLPGITAKIEIGEHDLYLKTAWYRLKQTVKRKVDGKIKSVEEIGPPRIIRIDITLSKGKDATDDLPKSLHTAGLEATRFDLARSWVENECRMASNLLQTGEAGIGTIIDEWAGVEGYPSGYCNQLPDPDTGAMATLQRGPLTAAAMLLRRNLVAWSILMEPLTNDG